MATNPVVQYDQCMINHVSICISEMITVYITHIISSSWAFHNCYYNTLSWWCSFYAHMIHIVIFLLFDHHEAFYADQVNYLVERELTCQCQEKWELFADSNIIWWQEWRVVFFDINDISCNHNYAICRHNIHPQFAVLLWLHLYIFKHFIIKIKCFLATK